jgi:hypothetical protein
MLSKYLETSHWRQKTGSPPPDTIKEPSQTLDCPVVALARAASITVRNETALKKRRYHVAQRVVDYAVAERRNLDFPALGIHHDFLYITAVPVVAFIKLSLQRQKVPFGVPVKVKDVIAATLALAGGQVGTIQVFERTKLFVTIAATFHHNNQSS